MQPEGSTLKTRLVLRKSSRPIRPEAGTFQSVASTEEEEEEEEDDDDDGDDDDEEEDSETTLGRQARESSENGFVDIQY